MYLAIDRQTGEEVAVKAMSKRRPKSTRERTLKKLVREAALQARVQHCSGVVKLLGAFEVRFFCPLGRAPLARFPFLNRSIDAVVDERGCRVGPRGEERRCRDVREFFFRMAAAKLLARHPLSKASSFFLR